MGRLLFVYNADNGLFSTVNDFAHKLVRPSTYACSLCMLTHGHFTAKQAWADFLGTLPETPEFLHRNEFLEQFGDPGTGFPVLFERHGEERVLVAGPAELGRLEDLQELIDLVRRSVTRN